MKISDFVPQIKTDNRVQKAKDKTTSEATTVAAGTDRVELTIPCHLEVFDWLVALFE